jgi:hypothetical protein
LVRFNKIKIKYQKFKVAMRVKVRDRIGRTKDIGGRNDSWKRNLALRFASLPFPTLC